MLWVKFPPLEVTVQGYFLPLEVVPAHASRTGAPPLCYVLHNMYSMQYYVYTQAGRAFARGIISCIAVSMLPMMYYPYFRVSCFSPTTLRAIAWSSLTVTHTHKKTQNNQDRGSWVMRLAGSQSGHGWPDELPLPLFQLRLVTWLWSNIAQSCTYRLPRQSFYCLWATLYQFIVQ